MNSRILATPMTDADFESLYKCSLDLPKNLVIIYSYTVSTLKEKLTFLI